jgi:hypothetical protein
MQQHLGLQQQQHKLLRLPWLAKVQGCNNPWGLLGTL